MSNFVYINDSDVSKLLKLDDTANAVEEALVCSVSDKRSFQNARSFTRILGSEDSVLLTMPGCLKSDKFGTVTGCKLVSFYPSNSTRSPPLPNILANITLFNEETGALEAVLGGTAITTWRTAAASMVATKYLTKHENVKIVSILGAGTQGRSHALSFHHFYKNLREIRIWNHNHSKSETLASELNLSIGDGKFKSFRSNQDCVEGADVIVTATRATKPIVQKEWVKQGAHINAVGAGLQHHNELSESIYLSSDVYVDHVEGAKSELSGLEKIGVRFKGAIGNVIKGVLHPTCDPNQITVFQSLGMAIEDCAVAKMIFDLYQKSKQIQ